MKKTINTHPHPTERRCESPHASGGEKSMRLLMFLMAFVLTSAGSFAQSVLRTSGTIDLEPQAPCQYLEINTADHSPAWWGFNVDGKLRTQNAAYDDWFSDNHPLPATYQGIISESAATATPALTPAQFEVATGGANNNLTYEQRMSLPPLTPPYLDAVAARDNHTAGGEIDQTIFTSGADKNGANTNTWMPGSGSVPQKVDIIDVGGHIKTAIEPISGNPHLIAAAFATTRNTSGDAHIDFEIYREDLEIGATGFINGGAQQGHTAVLFQTLPAINSNAPVQLDRASDILVSVDYSNGGTKACGSVWIWINPNNLDGSNHDTAYFNDLQNRPYDFTGDFFSGTNAFPYGYARILPKNYVAGNPINFFYAAINLTPVLSTTWGNLSAQNAANGPDADPLQVIEVGLDFTELGLITSNLVNSTDCSNILGTLLVKTRSSGSVTAEMKDFAGPYLFGVKLQANADAGMDKQFACSTTQVQLEGSSTTLNGIYQWNVIGGQGNIVSGGNTLTPTVDAAGCYELVVTSPYLATCIDRDTVCVSGQPDTIPPVISCMAGISVSCVADVPAAATSIAGFISAGGSVSGVAAGTGSISHSDGPLTGGACGGTITRTYTIADSCGNASTCNQIITVNDQVLPTITGPANLTIQQCNPVIPPASVNDASASDNCGSVTVSLLPDAISGTCQKTLTRTWIATDVCGNTASHVQVITYKTDNQAPSLTGTLPGGPVGNVCYANRPAAPATSLIAAQYSDNCSTPSVTLTSSVPSGNDCNWSVVYTYSVVDLCGNSTNAVVTYTGGDTQAPTLTGTLPGGAVGNVCYANRPAAPATSLIASKYSDNCSSVTATLTGTAPSGNDCSWSVVYTYTISDACGNTTTGAVTYTGGDTQAPTLNGTLPGGAVGNVCYANRPAAPATSLIAGLYSDNCNTVSASLTSSVPSGNDCSWSVVYTYKVEDICGNSTNAVVTYTGGDTEKPVVSCNVPGGNITVCEGSPVNFTPSATDNCASGPLTVTCTPAAPYALGTTTVTCSATDDCGNTGTCSFTVTVIPNPSCSIPSIPTPMCGSTDNVLTAVVSGTVSAPGTTTYNWTASNSSYIITSGQGTPVIHFTAGSGSNTFTLNVINSQNGVDCSSSCSYTDSCTSPVNCTYTQGYYGNAGGNNCTGGNTTNLLMMQLATDLVIGNCANGRCLTLTQNDVTSGCIYRRLPGGGPSAPIGDVATCDNPLGIAVKGNGSYRNVLLAQTITLGLNLRVPGSTLGNLQITGPYMQTMASTMTDCPSTGTGMPVSGTAQVSVIPQAVIDYLGASNTVADLFALANTALGTVPAPAGMPSLSAINQAVSAFNEGFDECRILDGFYQTNPLDTVTSTAVSRYDGRNLTTNVSVYPNPASETANIEFVLNGYDSEATLELYDINGVRVEVLFNTEASADVLYKVQLNAKNLPSGVYFYHLTTSRGIQTDRITIVK